MITFPWQISYMDAPSCTLHVRWLSSQY